MLKPKDSKDEADKHRSTHTKGQEKDGGQEMEKKACAEDYSVPGIVNTVCNLKR